jgi:hypothetical protein
MALRFLADHCISNSIVQTLRERIMRCALEGRTASRVVGRCRDRQG